MDTGGSKINLARSSMALMGTESTHYKKKFYSRVFKMWL